MPLYEYKCQSCGKTFEVIQKLADAPLTLHPKTGEPVRRVFGEPNTPRAWTDSQGASAVSDKNLASKGFTKYVKTGNGSYEKTAGSGPKKIQRD